MARYHPLCVFGSFWHRGDHRRNIRTKDNQALDLGLDMVPLVFPHAQLCLTALTAEILPMQKTFRKLSEDANAGSI
jgi:hypothetical protein